MVDSNGCMRKDLKERHAACAYICTQRIDPALNTLSPQLWGALVVEALPTISELSGVGGG